MVALWSADAELSDTVTDEVASETMAGDKVWVGEDVGVAVGFAVGWAVGAFVAVGVGLEVEAGAFTVTVVAVEFTAEPDRQTVEG